MGFRIYFLHTALHFASEISLDNSKGIGMLDRSFVIKYIFGRPHNII